MGNNTDNILEFLRKEKSFNYPAYHIEMLNRRITNRIIGTNSISIQNYYNLLTTDSKEADRLIENFMINVSYFFRDPLYFELLAKVFIPDLITSKLKQNSDTLRIWSAGCSHGEEAFSLAILINEYLEHKKLSINLDLFATDLDAGAIKNAKAARYTADSIKDVKFGFIEKYFTKNEGAYVLKPKIKSMVHFSIYDLLDERGHAPSESIFGDFDMILCRNVLIYFNTDFQEIIFRKIHKSLAAKGILVLGDTEVPPALVSDKFRHVSKHCKIFEKR